MARGKVNAIKGIVSVFLTLGILVVSGCASYAGRSLVVGQASADDVEKEMGAPAQKWQLPNGESQWAYPKGPSGTQTFMVRLDSAGRLLAIHPVLTERYFSQIHPDTMVRNDVVRWLGPARDGGSIHFSARRELVDEWLYCDSWNQQALFQVIFDDVSLKVKRTQRTPVLGGMDGISLSCGQTRDK